MPITSRQTRLVRVPDLRTYQKVIAELALSGDPRDIRRRAVIVPGGASARQLRRTIEADLRGTAALLPHIVSRGGWYALMHQAMPDVPAVADDFEREVMLYAAARDARDAGAVPPFTIRAGIVAAMLRFYDELRRRDCDLLTFQRRIDDELSKDVDDRGADRVSRQTRFLAESFARYERRLIAARLGDEHTLAARVRHEGSTAVTHVIVTVGDQTAEPGGLWPSDYRLLAESPGLGRIDIVATDRMLAAGLFDALERQLPGFEDERTEAEGQRALPTLIVPPPAPGDRVAPVAWTYRDREEELYGAVRDVRALADDDGVLRARVGIVFQRPLPYLYLARRAFEGARVPYLASDALPLAAEPYAAAVDLVLEFVWSNGSRAAAAALLRSPAFRFADGAGPVGTGDVTEFEQHVLQERMPGEPATYRAIVEAPPTGDRRRVKRQARARRVAAVAAACWDELADLIDAALPVGRRLASLVAFLRAHEAPPPADAEARDRHQRARAAILAAIDALGRAADRHAFTLSTDELAATIRRWIEDQTFTPRRGAGGVELVDATAARYGRFDHLRVLGLVEADWPVRPPRNVFYGRFLLAQLDWPDDQKRLALAGAAFRDLLCLPDATLSLSSFLLDDDALVGVSPYIDVAGELPLTREVRREGTRTLHFPWEALITRPVPADAVGGEAAAWVARRVARGALEGDRYRGQTGGYVPSRYSVSAIETYLRCPFKYFAKQVLRLPEERDDQVGMTPQERGHFLHEVVRAFYASWDADPGGPITTANVDEALARFRERAEAALASLPASDRAQERTLLLGSAASPGLAERLLYFEIELPGVATRRILEESRTGTFTFTSPERRRELTLEAIADRIDLLADDSLRVVDYKLGKPPDRDLALQLPVYGLCLSQALQKDDGVARPLTAAAYFSFQERKGVAGAVIYEGGDVATLLADGQARLLAAVDAIERGDFAPRPHKPQECRWCAYPSICRKEYAGDD